MADSYHHAVSSAKKWGGEPEDYMEVHNWLDASKSIICDYRHRALRHHAQGISECCEKFGPYIRTSEGKKVPTRWIAEQHVKEDFGHIPSFADWVRAIKHEPWMGNTPKLPVVLFDISNVQAPQITDEHKVHAVNSVDK